jgi:hypothetical protein
MEHESKTAAVKAATAWVGTGTAFGLERFAIHTWADVAAIVTVIYTLILILQWAMKPHPRLKACLRRTKERVLRVLGMRRDL